MSIAGLTASFSSVAGQRITLKHLGLRYQNNSQVIDVTGWHADGTPLAFVSAPFDGDPYQRAAEIAADLIRLHTGKPMPTPITGLAAVLRKHLAAANERAQKMANEFPDSVSTLHARLDEADKIKAEIDQASRDIHEAIGGGNGGPALGPLDDTPTPSSQS